MNQQEFIDKINAIDELTKGMVQRSKSTWKTYLLFKEIGHSKTERELNLFILQCEAAIRLHNYFLKTVKDYGATHNFSRTDPV